MTTAIFPAPPRETKRPRTFACNACGFATTTQTMLKRHQADVHGINVLAVPCTVEHCQYIGKSKDDVREHLRKFHGIGVKWHHCTEPNCEFKTKTANALKKHKQNRHNIDVVWYNCELCAFTCKQRAGVLQHARWMHSDRSVTYPERAFQRNQAARTAAATAPASSNMHSVVDMDAADPPHCNPLVVVSCVFVDNVD